MVWIYKQSTGEMFHNRELVDTGYAGVMTNKNNPDRQQVRGMGPLPRGRYIITHYTVSKGPYTLVLEQVSGQTFGRHSFRIHGERMQPPAGWASRGCIILGKDTRIKIWNSKDRDLEVIR